MFKELVCFDCCDFFFFAWLLSLRLRSGTKHVFASVKSAFWTNVVKTSFRLAVCTIYKLDSLGKSFAGSVLKAFITT